MEADRGKRRQRLCSQQSSDKGSSRHRSFSSIFGRSSTLGVGLVLALGLPGLATESAALCILTPDKESTLHLSAGQPLQCRLEYPDGAWLLRVTQSRVDIVLETMEPKGGASSTFDNPAGPFSPEVLLLDQSFAPGTLTFRTRDRATQTASFSFRLERFEGSALEAEALHASMAGAASFADAALEEAMRRFEEALEAWRALADRRMESWTLLALARLHHGLERTESARDLFDRAADLWQILGEDERRASALSQAALLHSRLGAIDAARRRHLEAIHLLEGKGRPAARALTRNNLCLLLHQQGELQKARDCYLEILPLLAGENRPQATVLNNLGGVHHQLGEPTAARGYFLQALELRRALGSRADEAETLNNLAALERRLGHWQEALAHYRSAVELYEKSGEKRRLAQTHNNIGHAYLTLGDARRALPSLDRALNIRREIKDRRGQAVTLNNLGLLHHQLGQHEMAAAMRRGSLEIRRQLDDPRNIGRTLTGLAKEMRALGEFDEARLYIFEAMALLNLRDRLSFAAAQAEYGTQLVELGEIAPAIELLRAASTVFEGTGAELSRLAVLLTLARAERQRGRLAAALAHAEDATDTLESLRPGVGSPDLLATFQSRRRSVYELQVNLLMLSDRPEKALEIAERASSRSLLDLLAEATSEPDFGVPRALAEQRRSAEEKIRELMRRRRSAEPAVAQALRSKIDRALGELDQLDATIRRSHPKFAAVAKSAPLDAVSIQALLDAESLLLHYVLGEEQSYVFRVTQDEIRGFELGPRGPIEHAARLAHRALATFDGSRRPAVPPQVAELSRRILGDVELDKKKLFVIADGALLLLPFAALGVAEAPLIEKHEVVHLPSASTWAELRRRGAESRSAPGPRLAIVADPVTDVSDPRLEGSNPPPLPRSDLLAQRISTAADHAPRLPSSGLEADAVAGFAPAGRVWQIRSFEARRDRLLAEDLSPFSHLHVAAHGLIDIERPAASGLLLSTFDRAGGTIDGFLDLGDLLALDLEAELVVLSACSTGLGQNLRGEGFIGLTRGLLIAGADRVIASLWQVEDRSTAELMGYFYQALFQEGLEPAAALRSAQRQLAADRRWRDPYFWAGFVVVGDH